MTGSSNKSSESFALNFGIPCFEINSKKLSSIHDGKYEIYLTPYASISSSNSANKNINYFGSSLAYANSSSLLYAKKQKFFFKTSFSAANASGGNPSRNANYALNSQTPLLHSRLFFDYNDYCATVFFDSSTFTRSSSYHRIIYVISSYKQLIK